MAIEIIKINGSPARNDIKRFMLDSVDEINKLPRQSVYGTINDINDPGINDPCGIGSEAVIKTGEIYLLWPDNQWGPW